MPPANPSKANVLEDYAARLRVVCPSAPIDDMACANLLANGFWDCRLCGGYETHHCMDYGVPPDGPYLEPLSVTGKKLTDEEMQYIVLMTANSINMNSVSGASPGGGSSSFVAVAGPVRYESATTLSSSSVKEVITKLKDERRTLCALMGGLTGIGEVTLGDEFFGVMGYIDGLTARQNSEYAYAGGDRLDALPDTVGPPAPDTTSYTTLVGDTVNTTYLIVHNLDALAPVVQVRKESTGQWVNTAITYVDGNALTITVDTPPGMLALRVTVII